MKKYNSYRGNVGTAAPNILNRNFRADQPLQKLVTDVTEFHLEGRKLYLSPIVDLYNGEVISYNLSFHPDMAQIRDMLEKAFQRIPDHSQAILHSDQGWQYQQWQYRGLLCQHGITQSMSRKGNCLDNSPVESFFNLLKRECLNRVKITSFQQFQNVIDQYIHWYNNIRISVNKKGMTPNEYIRYHSNL